MQSIVDVAIVGAGPYGLSLAAHLRARGVKHRICGEAMRFWRDMPVGINLKSFAFATNIAVPERGNSFPDWCRRNGLEDYEPCTMQSFAAYGMEMRERFVPEIDEVLATNIASNGNGKEFEVTLANSDSIRARHVVVCTGLSYLKRVPRNLQGLAPELLRHTAEISDYSAYRQKKVAIIGAGASAIEAGALVHEAGGAAEIFVRGQHAIIHGRTPKDRPLWRKIKEPASVLGVSRESWVLQHFPLLVYFMPKERRVPFAKGYLGPSAPWWIKDRVVGKVPIHLQHEVVRAEPVQGGLLVSVRDQSNKLRSEHFDCIIAGTGFDLEVRRLPFLDRGLVDQIRCTENAPDLNLKFESSVRGLHFLGPLSYMSFGPLFRFACGAGYTARTLARYFA
jgi:cation diffusion facilitator CzcD-associated flavoprotein CzcO